jgi:hypothetical protein
LFWTKEFTVDNSFEINNLISMFLSFDFDNGNNKCQNQSSRTCCSDFYHFRGSIHCKFLSLKDFGPFHCIL